jgi:GT2 family glycosyltransferase
MKIAVIFLDYLRHDFTKEALKSIAGAGYPFDLFTIRERGIAKAINAGIKAAENYDAIFKADNDILLPDNWLAKLVPIVEAIDNTGMAGFHCVEGSGELREINGVEVMVSFTAFGDHLITKKAIETVGYFNEDYDPYGLQDSDFAFRLNNSGFVNYYLKGENSVHIGHDVGNGSDYRKMKDDGLQISGEKWERWTQLYQREKKYYWPQ